MCVKSATSEHCYECGLDGAGVPSNGGGAALTANDANLSRFPAANRSAISFLCFKLEHNVQLVLYKLAVVHSVVVSPIIKLQDIGN